jgi:hypothetical protein
MKTNLSRGHNRHTAIGILAVAFILVSSLYNQADAQTANIGPNQYAFRFTGNPNFGLFFNAADARYEFRNSGANPIFGFSATNGRMTTNLQFEAGASYLVAPNRYALRSAANSNIGLYFGSSDYEFRNASGTSVLNINANTGEMVSTAGIAAQGLDVEAESGQVSINSTGFLGGTSKVGFSNLGAENGYVQMSFGILQLMNTTELGAIAFGNNSELHSIFDGDGRLCINTNIPAGRLTVVGEQEQTEDVINATVTYEGTTDVTAVRAVSVPASGTGFGVSATGGYMGVRGIASALTYTGTSYGVYGNSVGSFGTSIGVYGTASGTGTTWAVYSAGNTYVSGDLRIGNQTDVTGFRFSVDGRAICEELKVQVSGNWPDYVFAEDYSIMNLDELEAYIEKENHLPGIPSAAEVEEADGIMLGEMQRLTLEKLEELTLYILDLKKENDQSTEYILELKKENDALKARVDALEN